MPIYEYSHDDGCSVTGGVVVRGGNVHSLNGWYLFGDWCSGTLSALRRGVSGAEVLAIAETGPITSINAAPNGVVYVVDHSGTLFRVDAA